MLNAVDGAPMLLCSDVLPRTLTEPVIESPVYVKKLEMIVKTASTLAEQS